MPHHHMAHHVARQRNNDENNDQVATSVKVVVVTLPKTFSGEAVWVTRSARPQQETVSSKPARRTRPPKTVATDESSSGRVLPAPTTRARETSATPTSEQESSSAAETESSSSQTPSPTPTINTTTLMVASSSPSPTAEIAAASESPSASPSASATAVPVSTGMSGGAKAGLALGILVGIGALLAVVLLVYHRKKKSKAAEAKMVDNEKNLMKEVPPPPPVDDSPRTTRTMSTAPRLSLRPVTQFSPTLPEHRKSAGNMLNVAAAMAPRDRSPSPQMANSPANSWEKPGAGSSDAANPFGDPQNPFGNDAAIVTPQPSFPNTPNTTGPEMHLNDFANPASAIAAADATSGPSAPVVTPVSAQIPRKEVPAPLSVRSEAGAMSFAQPSPAWTEDFPASPGPAPSGPPPIATAGGAVNASGSPSPVNNVHRVQLDFKPSMNDELELHAGQLVRMLHEYDDGWALCLRMDRSQQGVVPRTCLSKHPVKPRNGPPRQGPPGPPHMRGPPPMHAGVPQPRPLTPNGGRNSPHPPIMQPANGRMSPGPRAMSPGPRAMSPGPRPMSPAGGPRTRSNSNAPYAGPPRSMSPGPRPMSPAGGPRGRSNSNAPYPGPQRSMSPGPYGGSYQPPQAPMGRPRANSTGQVAARRGPAPGPSPMNPNAFPLGNAPVPARKPLPGQAI